jgi:hypothetical protein
MQEDLLNLIEECGFQARLVGKGAVEDCNSAILRISGMTCSSCSSAVEAALLGHQGVQVFLDMKMFTFAVCEEFWTVDVHPLSYMLYWSSADVARLAATR